MIITWINDSEKEILYIINIEYCHYDMQAIQIYEFEKVYKEMILKMIDIPPKVTFHFKLSL
jgi:hypothetical protein